jgi:hypothetical protein
MQFWLVRMHQIRAKRLHGSLECRTWETGKLYSQFCAGNSAVKGIGSVAGTAAKLGASAVKVCMLVDLRCFFGSNSKL